MVVGVEILMVWRFNVMLRVMAVCVIQIFMARLIRVRVCSIKIMHVAVVIVTCVIVVMPMVMVPCVMTLLMCMGVRSIRIMRVVIRLVLMRGTVVMAVHMIQIKVHLRMRVQGVFPVHMAMPNTDVYSVVLMSVHMIPTIRVHVLLWSMEGIFLLFVHVSNTTAVCMTVCILDIRVPRIMHMGAWVVVSMLITMVMRAML